MPVMIHPTELMVIGPRIALGHFQNHAAHWSDCCKCAIGCQAKHKVFGRGSLMCDVLFLGEGPGKDEDETGFPFVGRSGNLLEKVILDVSKQQLFTYFITNTVACRPTEPPPLQGHSAPKDRAPTPGEQENCRLQVLNLFELVRPRLVITMGRVAEEWWRTAPRDFVEPFEGRGVLHVYHPAYILRSGGVTSVQYNSWYGEIARFITSRVDKRND